MPYGYPTEPRTVGEHLRKRRLDLQLLQREVAVIISVNGATIQNWETGSHSVSLSAWPAVLEFLGYDPRPSGQTLGEMLRLRRESLGLSTADLARQLGIDPSTVTRYELKPDHLQDHLSISKIAQFLGHNPLPEPDSPKEYVRQARYLLGLSQRELANRLRVCTDLVSRWERNETCPTTRHLDRIEALLADLTESLRLPCAEHVRAVCASAKRPDRRTRPRSTAPVKLENLGDHIRKRRLDLGLSQAALAKQFGINRNAVTRWEAGLDEPGLKQMPKAIEFLGYDPTSSDGELAYQIRSNRRALGLSQAEFGKLLGVSRETVNLWENGKRVPGESTQI
ncbi:MAG: helix-turn-helix domain-containing protein [Candidatus Hydrogenedentes bacterium]|nr:helix-turn-helix domain-containing protein [Candidatus Hydrogenedentota bacterium]